MYALLGSEFLSANFQNNIQYESWRYPLRKILDPPLVSVTFLLSRCFFASLTSINSFCKRFISSLNCKIMSFSQKSHVNLPTYFI